MLLSRCFLALTAAVFTFQAHGQDTNAPTLNLEKAKLTWSGDIRYRLGKKRQADDDARHYQQVRARLGLEAEVSDVLKGNLRLASGTSPLSTNQMLGDDKDPGMPRRFFGIDHAFITWKYLPDGKLWAGRTPNPFWTPGRSQILFDSDLAFEGVAVKYEPMWGGVGMFVNLGSYVISDEYSAPNDIADIGIAAADVGMIVKGEDWTWTSHVAHFNYLNVQDKEIVRVNTSAKIDTYSAPFKRYAGNTVYELAGPKYYYENKYVLFEAGTEWKHTLGTIEYTLFFDWVKNMAVSSDANAAEYGLNVKYKWFTGGFAMIEKQADSLVGAFTDDDAGGGGTDHRGWRILLDAQITKSASIVASFFRADRGLSTTQRSYEGTYLDAVVRF